MGRLINLKTRQYETVPEDELESSLAAGTHGFKKGGRLTVVDPESSEVLEIPTERIYEALDAGYQIERSLDKAVREEVAKPANSGLRGGFRTFLSNMGDEALGGIPELIADETQDPFDVAKRSAMKDKFALANAAGGILGLGGSLFVPGAPLARLGKGATIAGKGAQAITSRAVRRTVGERVAKSVVGRTAANAAKMGTELVAFEAPRMLTEAALGDGESIAEQLLADTGRSFALGAGMGGVGTPIGAVLKAIGSTGIKATRASAPAFKKWSEFFSLKATGMSKAEFRKLRKQHRAGGDAALRASEAGRMILDEKLISATSKVEDTAKKIDDLLVKVGEDMNYIYGVADSPFVRQDGRILFDTKAIIQDIESTIGRKVKNNPMYTPNLPEYTRAVKRIEMLGDNPMLSNVQEAIKDFNKAFTEQGIGKTGMEITQAVRSKAAKGLEKAVEKVFPPKEQAAEFLKRFKSAKRKWGTLQILARTADNGAAGQFNHFVNSFDMIIGGSVGGATGSLTGGVAAAAVNIARRRYQDQMLAVGLNNLAKASERVVKNIDGAMNSALVKAARRAKAPAGIVPASVGTLKALSSNKKATSLEAYNEFADKLSSAVGNPEGALEQMTQMTEALSDSAPGVAAQMQAKLATALQYLAEQMPSPANVPNILGQKEWQPSDRQVAAFERKLKVVLDPLSILDDLETGTLTKDSVAALEAVYPKIYQAVQEKAIELAADEDVKLPYNMKVKLSLLLNAALDRSLDAKFVADMQKNYAKDSKNKKPQANSKIRVDKGMATEFDQAFLE